MCVDRLGDVVAHLKGFIKVLYLIAAATGLALMTLGGGVYEVLVVDPAWPQRPELIQPVRGGISRRRFWIPAHVAFEVALIAGLIWSWSQPSVSNTVLVALASHAVMRLWSAFDFIPKAVAFERAETVSEAAARAWTGRSWMRLVLDVITCVAMLLALIAGARLG
jgi:hypothetical protein